MFKKILVGVDESVPARRAILVAGELAANQGSQIALLHVLNPPVVHGPSMLEEVGTLQKTALQESHRLLASLHPLLPQDILIDDFVVFGRPADQIVEHARAWKADLVIVGNHNRHALSRFLLGSTADRVVRKAHCPVLIVRELDEGEAIAQHTRNEPDQICHP